MQRVLFILKEELLALRKFNELQQEERDILLYGERVEDLLTIQQVKNKVLSLIEDVDNKRKKVFEGEGIGDVKDLPEEAKELLDEVLKEWRKLQIMREYNISLLGDRMNFNLKYLEALKDELKEQFEARAVAFDQRA